MLTPILREDLTMNTYAHVLPRLQRDATTKIEELLDAAHEEPPPDTVD